MKKDGANQELCDIIKEKLMPKSSKQSADVISKLGGKDKITEEFELSDNVKQSIETTSKKVKKTTIGQLAQNDENNKKKLVRREQNRQANRLKEKLAQALYTEDETGLEDQNQLEMLFLLNELGKKNEEAQKVTNRVNEKKKQTSKELQYYEMKDGTKVFDETRDGNPDLTKKLRRLETRIHGPEVDVLDLINYLGR